MSSATLPGGTASRSAHVQSARAAGRGVRDGAGSPAADVPELFSLRGVVAVERDTARALGERFEVTRHPRAASAGNPLPERSGNKLPGGPFWQSVANLRGASRGSPGPKEPGRHEAPSPGQVDLRPPP